MQVQAGRSSVRSCLLMALFLLLLVIQIFSIPDEEMRSEPMRILYVVTTLNEYDNGRKGTRFGSDRLKTLLIPVLSEGVNSMIQSPYHYQVDVYLILGYTLRQERFNMIRQSLPPSVGLDVWQDATPVTYDLGRKSERIRVETLTRALSRQHRYVIKDKLLNYDFFVAFEDDMLIKGDHVHHYVTISNEIERLRRDAPVQVQKNRGLKKPKLAQQFYGEMNKQQLSRMVPGFLRVEVLLDRNNFGTQKELDPIPVDLQFPVSSGGGLETIERRVDPRLCCHVSEQVPMLPRNPATDKIFIWETGVRALGVREMPESSNLSWVMLLRGNRYRFMTASEVIGDYWSGRDGAFENGFGRPFEGEPQYLSNQGGWMATQQQIWEWHIKHCQGGFLPPFNEPVFKNDGLFNKNVEFWSGGLQISQSSNCNLQRIVDLDPDSFSRQLLYHTANNKQFQLKHKIGRFVKVDHLLGQLNAVRKKAQEAKAAEAEGAKSIFRLWW